MNDEDAADTHWGLKCQVAATSREPDGRNMKFSFTDLAPFISRLSQQLIWAPEADISGAL